MNIIKRGPMHLIDHVGKIFYSSSIFGYCLFLKTPISAKPDTVLAKKGSMILSGIHGHHDFRAFLSLCCGSLFYPILLQK